MLNGYFGGYSTMTQKLMNLVETMTGERDFEWRDVPIASRVLKQGDERTAARKMTNEYFNLLDEYYKTQFRLKGYEDKIAQDGEDAVSYAERLSFLNHSPEYARYLIMDSYKTILDALHDEKKTAVGDDKSMIETWEYNLRKEILDMVDEFAGRGVKSISDKAVSEIEERIEDNMSTLFDNSTPTIRDKAGDVIARNMGGTDSYGSPTTGYGIIYERLRDYVDLAEDVQLQVAKKEAKEAGDTELASRIDKMQRELTDLKSGVHTKTKNIPGLGEGSDEDDVRIMDAIREKRYEFLQELGR
jgi:hypothetical protein